TSTAHAPPALLAPPARPAGRLSRPHSAESPRDEHQASTALASPDAIRPTSLRRPRTPPTRDTGGSPRDHAPVTCAAPAPPSRPLAHVAQLHAQPRVHRRRIRHHVLLQPPHHPLIRLQPLLLTPEHNSSL